MITITINGESNQLPEKVTIAQLLNHKALQPEKVAVVKNGEVIPKSLWPDTLCVEQDRFDIFTVVAGG
ncbi:sulfur carrier protein ThiS [Shewanella maritima]|uniref:sulfur carrier protein ThiS n=1 Tax=Shewanella maritima TaxID=2520507 RepID=UPI003734E74E